MMYDAVIDRIWDKLGGSNIESEDKFNSIVLRRGRSGDIGRWIPVVNFILDWCDRNKFAVEFVGKNEVEIRRMMLHMMDGESLLDLYEFVIKRYYTCM